MLGKLIDSLDDPKVALGLVTAVNEPSLHARLAAAADTAARSPADIVASSVRGFLDSASDDDWVQLVGVMNRAEDPGLAALRTILEKSLPALREA